MKELNQVTIYFCKQCEKQTLIPIQCNHCDAVEFWDEFDDGAPCNRLEEEEEDPEYYYDGEYDFELKKVA